MKNILLIGGSYGIGWAIAQELAPTAKVYVASRTAENLQHSAITHIPFDVTTDTLDTGLLPEQLDGFVYCPGSINLKPFKRLTAAHFENDFQLNFLGLVNTLHQITPLLQKSQQASLVFFSTVATRVGMPFHTSVAASKSAVEGFAKALAAEYAPSLRVNVVAPSLTDTPLAEKLLSNAAKREKMDQKHPLKRIGQAKDIAKVVTFLLSDDSSWMTGQVLGIDGGISTLNQN